MRDFRSNRYNNSWPRRDFAGQSGPTNTQVVNAVFRELVHQVLEKVKNEPFFKWPNKRIRLSLRKGGISGWTDTITAGHGEILLVNQDLPTLRRSM